LLNISVGNGEDVEDEVDTSQYQTYNIFKDEENRSCDGGMEDGMGDDRGGEGVDVLSLISLPSLSLSSLITDITGIIMNICWKHFAGIC
jgi:hypothetical protein